MNWDKIHYVMIHVCPTLASYDSRSKRFTFWKCHLFVNRTLLAVFSLLWLINLSRQQSNVLQNSQPYCMSGYKLLLSNIND
jgi:hypothetical protein